VEVEFCDRMIYCPGDSERNWRKTFHYKGSSEAAAKARAMRKKHAKAVVSTRPWWTEEEYIRVYGRYWEKGY
jgi:hypothetical protein